MVEWSQSEASNWSWKASEFPTKRGILSNRLATGLGGPSQQASVLSPRGVAPGAPSRPPGSGTYHVSVNDGQLVEKLKLFSCSITVPLLVPHDSFTRN